MNKKGLGQKQGVNQKEPSLVRAVVLGNMHVGGLPQLGPEAMAVQNLPVHAAQPLMHLLQEARIWRPLVQGLQLRPFIPLQPLMLTPDLTITPIPVPHRDEWQVGTFAFHVQGPRI